MRKKNFNFSTPDLPNSAFLLSLVLSFTCVFLDCNQAWGDSKDAPGLPIARLTLPALPVDTAIVSATGTYVGGKVNEFNTLTQKAEEHVTLIIQSTRELYENAIAAVSQYHLTVSEIEAKLQLGTTPGNPLLIALYDAAHTQLNQIMNTIGKMDSLANDFRQSSEQMDILSEHIKATLHIPGAVDEDHAHLILMSDELTNVQFAIAQTLTILNANEKRQNEWLASENTHFTQLSLAIDKGKIITPELGPISPYPLLDALPEIKPSKGAPISIVQMNEKTVSESVSESVPVPILPLPQSPHQELKEEVVREIPVTPELPVILVESESAEEEETSELPQANIIIPEPRTPELISPQGKPLPLVDIASRPVPSPIPEEEVFLSSEEQQSQSSKELMDLSVVLKGRAPLGIVDNQQDLHAQKWYIFSTANRALKKPTNIIEIINVIENNEPTSRGDEIKKLLVEMGINPSQLQVINAKIEDGQRAHVMLLRK